jgi:uncharacterized protein YcbX
VSSTRQSDGARLSEIRIYPVKSLAGVAVGEAEVEPWGLRHDRRWLLLNPDGTVLTAREHHDTLALTAAPDDDGGVTITAPDRAVLRVPPPFESELLPTTLSRLESVRAAGSDADHWLSRQLRRPVRLGWLDDPRRRTVSDTHGGRPGDHLNLADAGPLLLTAQASLRRLNHWADQGAAHRGDDPGSPLVMTRFRPNVVIDGSEKPFVEDEWATLRIGSVAFRLGEHCNRCVLTTIDPDTRRGGKEPLRTLAKHRQWDHKTWFGIRLIPVTTGRIRIGDAVTGADAGQKVSA